QRDRAHQKVERGAYRTYELLPQRKSNEGFALVGVRKGRLQSRADGCQLRVDRVERCARPGQRQDAIVVRGAAYTPWFLRVRGGLQPDFGLTRKAKACGNDADDRVGDTFHVQRLAESRCPRTEVALREGEADNGATLHAVLVWSLAHEAAPKRRCDSECR